jgi:hypothetical protein
MFVILSAAKDLIKNGNIGLMRPFAALRVTTSKIDRVAVKRI